MAHHRKTANDGFTLIITDICNRCGTEGAQPHDIEPGDAFQCTKCNGWSEVMSRFAEDNTHCCIWFSPIDRKAPAPR